MNTFTPTPMNKITTFVFAAVLLAAPLLLPGCSTTPENPYIPPSDAETQAYDSAADQKFRFERMRVRNRNSLTEEAQKSPDKMTYVTMSLWDYYPITTLVDFEKKYPGLKVTWTEFMVRGMFSSFEINPELTLKNELDRYTQKKTTEYERELQEVKDNPGIYSNPGDLTGAQAYVDAIKAGNIRTFGFGVRGKLKDIEAMARQEYGEHGQNKMIRVIMEVGILSTGEVAYSAYEPIYANEDKTVDRYK